MRVRREEEEHDTCFWVNGHCPTFLAADPPAAKGKISFEAEFSVDGNERLLVTARDLKTGRKTHQDYPVVRLS